MAPAAGPASASPSGKRTLQGVDGTVAIMNGISTLAVKGLSLHLGRAAHPRSFLRVRSKEVTTMSRACGGHDVKLCSCVTVANIEYARTCGYNSCRKPSERLVCMRRTKRKPALHSCRISGASTPTQTNAS